ncbi:MAG: ferredoxin family protein [Chloroflexota bacterium]|nr:ferredoxin family protein [Chloroflexota bacterium]
MAYVITEPCVDVKDKSCVNVCPVDCIYEDGKDARVLYIHPDECIDCGACEPECPVNAIFAEEEVPDKWKTFVSIARLSVKNKEEARTQIDKLYPEKRSAD